MPGRATAIVALAIPVFAGLLYLWAHNAPAHYAVVNCAALAIAALWISFAPRVARTPVRRALIGLALIALFLPLLTGPATGGVARWLPLGPFVVHAGMLVAPAIVVLAGDEPDHAPGILSIALLAALVQPDMALGAALTLAAFGFYDATKDWRYGAFAAVAFGISLAAAAHGELPARPHVERIIFLLARSEPLAALGLVAALAASFFLFAGAVPGRETARKGLAGCLFGFAFAGHVSNYPSPLIGYGAAPILGFGLALGLMAGAERATWGFPTRRPSA